MNKSKRNKKTKKDKKRQKKTKRNKKTKKDKKRQKKTKRNKRTKKFRNKNIMGGMKVYEMDGEFTTNPEILHEGKDFFRKMTRSKREKDICELLMKNPHKNIVKIYGIDENYIDMELLNTDMSSQDVNRVISVMEEVKTYLQSLGIMYIDWKLDNIGMSDDGEIKLFDFDASGLINIETEEWIMKPPMLFWSYRTAIQNGMETPTDIDNYAFYTGFKEYKS